MMDYQKSMPNYYTLADEISRGTFYVCMRCIDLRDKLEYTAKIIHRDQLELEPYTAVSDIEHEAQLLKYLLHPNIVTVYDSFEVGNFYCIISELLAGPSLLDAIVIKANDGYAYSEAVASFYMNQLFEGIAYLHRHRIIHCHIEIHNLVLSSNADDAPLKITDFRHTKLLSQSDQKVFIGNVCNTLPAPETLQTGEYECASDMWSCGVILYTLLHGRQPFNIDSKSIVNDIVTGKYEIQPSDCDIISDQAKHLVDRLLSPDPCSRFTIERSLKDIWLKTKNHSMYRTHLAKAVVGLASLIEKRKRQIAQNQRIMKTLNTGNQNPMTGLSDTLGLILNDTGGDDEIHQLKSVLSHKTLKSLLKIHSLITKSREQIQGDPFEVHCLRPNAQETLEVVNTHLNTVEGVDSTCRQLKDILGKPHVMALIRARDEVLKDFQGKNDQQKNHDVLDDLLQNLTRVRLVQFTKNNDDALGVTFKINDNNHCVVTRILHGGMVHRQGTLHVGDEIREINGIDVSSVPSERLQRILSDARGEVTFKIVPAAKVSDVSEPKLHVRCMFDYEPSRDDLIPCQSAGLRFKCGERLEILSRKDFDWWQARKVSNSEITGLIPSPEFQERRLANEAQDTNLDGKTTCFWSKRKQMKKCSRKYSARLNTAFDKLCLLTYEELSYSKKWARKTVVLIGAHGVGRRHIKNALISKYADRFAYPIPHTSRKPSPGEKCGVSWFFEPEKSMLGDIGKHEYLEYGKHEGAIYGTKLSTIKNIIKCGKTPVIDPEIPALKILRSKEFSPYIIFISSPQSFATTGDSKMDSSLMRLITESRHLQELYEHYFDFTVVNNSIENTVNTIINHLNDAESKPDWIPSSWFY